MITIMKVGNFRDKQTIVDKWKYFFYFYLLFLCINFIQLCYKKGCNPFTKLTIVDFDGSFDTIFVRTFIYFSFHSLDAYCRFQKARVLRTEINIILRLYLIRKGLSYQVYWNSVITYIWHNCTGVRILHTL